MKVTRLEKNGIVAYTNGKETKMVPAERACRERLVKLLKDANGDPFADVVEQFWFERSKECGDLDELRRAWADEVFERLYKIFEELVSPPAVADEEDIFSVFQ